VVGAIGWRLHGRGLRTYGAALIGAGGAIIYLVVWAATRLYQFLPPFTGILGLALVSVGVAAVAFAINIEALGAAAVLGAFFAPILLGKEAGSVNSLLIYLGSMAAGLGWVSSQRKWRIATFLVALSYFGITASGVLNHAATPGLYLYAILGGSAGLYVGLREGWWETRLLAFSGGWAVLAMANDKMVGSHWPTLLGGLVLAAPVWWRAWRSTGIWYPGIATGGGSVPISLGETFYFYSTPFLIGWALHSVNPALFSHHGGLVAALVSLPYLVAGYTTPRYPFAFVGTTALALAALGEWDGLGAVAALLALTHLWALLDHPLARQDGRWYALLALGVGLYHLVAVDLPARPDSDAAFLGHFPLAVWLATETSFVLAAGLLATARAKAGHKEPINIRAVLWTLGGILILLGVTGELVTWFNQSTLDLRTQDLASGLSVSAWWIIFAAAVVGLGFRRSNQVLRQAGILVLGLAVLKVVFWDLSSLSALYRVGSAFILGLVSLALAYQYHRRGQGRGVAS
jgi:uncharacterized membrane protein